MTKLRLWNRYSTKTIFNNLKCSTCRKTFKLDEYHISIELYSQISDEDQYIVMCKKCWLGEK